MRASRSHFAGVGLGVLLLSSLAHGQVATPMRVNEGPGVKLSESLVFHPGAAVEMRYDSNVLFADSQLKGAPYLRLIGHFDLATRSPQRLTDAATGATVPQKINFRLNSSLGYREYLSGGDVVREQRAFEALAGLLFSFMPSRHFGFEVTDAYSRIVTPQNSVTGLAGATSSATIARDMNRAAAMIKLAPGGGRLTFDAGYALNLDAFEDVTYEQNNRLFHEILFNGRWRILPKTAIFIDVMQQFVDYYNGAGVARLIGSKPFRAYGGLAGLLTPRLSILLKAGYGNSLHDSGAAFSSVIGKAELGYQFSPTARLHVGYERAFAESFFGNYYADHVALLGYDHLIAGRFVLHLSGDYRFRQYEGTTRETGITVDTLDANLVTAAVGFDWQIKDWVYVGIGYDLQLQTVGQSFDELVGWLDYGRHQVFGKVGFSY